MELTSIATNDRHIIVVIFLLIFSNSIQAQIAPPPPLPGKEASLDPFADRSIKKRIAVMPIVVGRLATELGMSSPLVSSITRDHIEQHLQSLDKFIIANRSGLSDVISEQQLSKSNMFNSAIGPKSGKLIPAQFLVYFTVNDLFLEDSSLRTTNSKSDELIRRAEGLESQARSERANLASQQRSVKRSLSRDNKYADVSLLDCSQSYQWCMNKFNSTSYCDIKRSTCLSNNAMRSMKSASGRAQAEASSLAGLESYNLRIRKMNEEARSLREQAKWTLSESTSSSTRSVKIHLMWRAVDTSTGAVVGSGDSYGTQLAQDSAISYSSGSNSSLSTVSTAYNDSIHSAMRIAIAASSKDMVNKIGKEPFIAKVIKFDDRQKHVVINAGENMGVKIGDTFGVRDLSSLLVDPDTGEILSSPGPPTGIIWISSSQSKISTGVIIKGFNNISYGAELVHIGHNPSKPKP